MDEVLKIKIEGLVMDLEDAFWITEKVKTRYTDLQENQHYKRILEAIATVEKEHDALYELIKED